MPDDAAVRPLRITFILPAYYRTPIGGYRIVYEYADFLASRGHAVTIIFPRRQREAGADASWLEPVKKRLWGLKTRFRNRPLVPWHSLHPNVRLRLVPDLSDRHIGDGDVVVATAWSTAPPVAALAQAKGSKFYLIQSHETWAGPEAEVDATWRLPLHKIVVSKWLQAVGERLEATGIRHITNGIDLRRFRITTPPGQRPLSIVTLNHAHEIKGVPDALAALTRYHERCPAVPVSMFGAIPRGADIPGWITYVANPTQDDLVEQVYNTHAIYLGASLQEGWGLPPAEAMACGCAFVGTDIGGFREFATHGDTALLSPPGDRDALFQNLVRLTQDDRLRSRIQQRGTAHIRQFTWATAGMAMEAYFQEHVTGTAIPAGHP